ncbi:MAG TPA: ankyrin repeat domain-containing protein [Mucilaginibacter sp.]|jgi:ankyrin repeat protein|nr:ankyrin repeat domain-containing protein [Mucilaginibacter sp.]
MKLNIDELKLILINKSLIEIKAALGNFDVACFDKNGNNILHYYLKGDQSLQTHATSVIQLFIDLGIDINAKALKMPKKTALHIAVLMKSRPIFDVLLKNGVDVNVKDGNGNTALSDAVYVYRGDDGYFIETLISNGAQVDVMNNYGVSPKGLAETIANYDTRKFFSQY